MFLSFFFPFWLFHSFTWFLYFRIVHPDFLFCFVFVFCLHAFQYATVKENLINGGALIEFYYSILWVCEWFSFALFEFCGHVNIVWQSQMDSICNLNSEGIYNHNSMGIVEWPRSVLCLFAVVTVCTISSSMFFFIFSSSLVFVSAVSTLLATVKPSKIT